MADDVTLVWTTESPVKPVSASAAGPFSFLTLASASANSGVIRRAAFRYSENDLRHWLMLMGADRVNVVEGLGQDLRRSPRAVTR